MPVAKVGGVDVNFRVLGEHGPWLALTPGGRRGHEELLTLSELIARAGFRVLLHDRRNTGASEIRIDGDDPEEVIWVDDLAELLRQLDALPCFVGGFSSGSRMSMLFGLRHPHLVRALLLGRVTGGETAARRLPENYYDQFIRAARSGGMEAVLQTEQYKERIAANPMNHTRLMAMDAARYISVMEHWRALFVDGARHPVMGVSEAELKSIRLPTLVIPGNDRTHSRASGMAAHQFILGSELRTLPIEDEDRDIIPFEEWGRHEPQIASWFVAFMSRFSGDGKPT